MQIGFTVSDRYRRGCLVGVSESERVKLNFYKNSSHKKGRALEKEAKRLTVAVYIPIKVVHNMLQFESSVLVHQPRTNLVITNEMIVVLINLYGRRANGSLCKK